MARFYFRPSTGCLSKIFLRPSTTTVAIVVVVAVVVVVVEMPLSRTSKCCGRYSRSGVNCVISLSKKRIQKNNGTTIMHKRISLPRAKLPKATKCHTYKYNENTWLSGQNIWCSCETWPHLHLLMVGSWLLPLPLLLFHVVSHVRAGGKRNVYASILFIQRPN